MTATSGGQELQCDRLVERQVVGAVHLAHAAAAEQRDESIPPGDDRARREAVRRSRRAVTGPAAPARVLALPRRQSSGRRPRMRDTADSTGGASMTRKLIAASLARAGHGRSFARAGSAVRRARPARRPPRSAAATCRAERRPSYQGGKWIEITYGRPIKRGRDLWGPGANYGRTLNDGRAGLARRRECHDPPEDGSPARHQRQDGAGRRATACSSISSRTTGR